MKRCSQIRRLRERGFLETLSLDEEFLIEQHADQCQACAQILEREERFDRLLHGLPDAPVERLDVARSTDLIWDQVDAREAIEPRAPRRVRHLLALAASLAVLASLFALWRTVEGPQPAAPLRGQSPVDPSPVAAQPVPKRSAEPQVVMLEPADLDLSRLGRARAEVREHLVAAAGLVGTDTSSPEFLRQVEQLDESLALNLGSWPVLRIIEGLARDPDARVACVALRYLGLRGDATSVRVLGRALRDVDLVSAAVEGLCDHGERGLAGLIWAYWNTPQGERVGQHLRTLAARDSASNRACVAWVRASVGAAPGSVPLQSGAALLVLLADIESLPVARSAQPEGLAFLFDLVSDSRWNTLALDALAQRTGAHEYLALTLAHDGPTYPESVRLDVIQRLGTVTALPWLEATCRRGEESERALEVLAQLDGVDVIESLIYLRSGIAPKRFAAAWRTALKHDRGRFTDHAWRTVSHGGRAEHVTYLDLLLAYEPAQVVPAICALSSSSMLADDDRERALLIAGELGGEEDLAALRLAFDSLEHDDLDLAAACLWSARRLGGLADDASASSWLGTSNVNKRRRVLDLLPQGAQPRDATLRRFRLARELEAILSIRDESDRFARGTRHNSSEGTTP